MEFRGIWHETRTCFVVVDIGTEWNLEQVSLTNHPQRRRVDIGTEWNLESIARHEGAKF